MKRTPDRLSKKRQDLCTKRDLWREKAADLELKLAARPGQRTFIVKQIEFCADEAQKCIEALEELSTLTRSQRLAGWGETRSNKPK